MKKCSFLALLILCACSSGQKPSKVIYDPRLIFDVEAEVKKSPCNIQGKIPDWLSGTLLRDGSGKFHVGDKEVDFFDGLAMLHAFEFTPDQVLYTNRFIRSEQYYIMVNEKSLNYKGFAMDPCPIVFKNQTSKFIPQEMKNITNAGVSIQQYADKIVALTEAPLPVVFDPQTLETIGVFDYQDQLEQGPWESAHPQLDSSDQEMVNYFVKFGPKSSYVVWRMPGNQSAREVIAEIPVEFPSYMHSFALTERYVVLTEFPFVVNPLDLVQEKKPFIFNYQWKPERGTVFNIIDRSTGVVTKIKGPPFFAFHHVNAYDKEGQIIMDICTHANADIISVATGKITQKSTAVKSQKTQIERFTIDIATQVLSREVIFNETADMPRVHPNKVAHEYRYAYLAFVQSPTPYIEKSPLHKVDVVAKTAVSWEEEGCWPGEPIFVPRPNGQSEDDGVVLSLILDYVHHRSFLLILDAASFKEIARAEAPHAIPVGLHGMWKD
ncbi:MAG TPA: carotenoid oxygenase family protein [Rhabdochlamydiaceae bacterium]